MSTSIELETWVIRCQGLPRRVEGLQPPCNYFDIVNFFSGCNFKNGAESIHYSSERRDEIYIEMASRNDLQKALNANRKLFSPRFLHQKVTGN